MWGILDRQVGGRDRDVAGLTVVEFLEEVGGELGIFSNEGVEFMAGRCWGIDGQVRVSRHCLVVEAAEGILTKSGVGLTVFKGGSLFRLAVLGSLRSGCF